MPSTDRSQDAPSPERPFLEAVLAAPGLALLSIRAGKCCLTEISLAFAAFGWYNGY